MSDKEDCMYCKKDSRLDELMLEVIKLEICTVYLYREISYPGRCVLALNRHVHKLTEISNQERNGLLQDVTLVASAIGKLYQPDNINYLILGDKSPHLHIHIVPKYEKGKDWGCIFQMMPAQPIKPTGDESYSKQISLLRQELLNLC